MALDANHKVGDQDHIAVHDAIDNALAGTETPAGAQAKADAAEAAAKAYADDGHLETPAGAQAKADAAQAAAESSASTIYAPLASPAFTGTPTVNGEPLGSGAVTSVVGQTGDVTAAEIKAAVTYTKADVGLGNVDNTADADKPISTAQADALALKAPLASPAFTGTPTVNGNPIGSGDGLPAGLTSTDSFSPITTETLIDDCESLTNWTSAGGWAGAGPALDSVHQSQGTADVSILFSLNISPPIGHLRRNYPVPVDITNQGHVAVDVTWLANGPGLPAGVTIDDAFQIVVSDGADGTGNRQTVTFPIVSSGAAMTTVVLPLAGLSAIASIGVEVTAGDTSTTYRAYVFVDNIRFPTSTALDEARASAVEVGVLVPPTYAPVEPQRPLARQDGKTVLDMRDNYAYLSGIGGTRHLREWQIVEDGSADVTQAINKALADLKPGETLLGAPGALYRVDGTLLGRSDVTVDLQGAALFRTAQGGPGIKFDGGVRNTTWRRFRWYGFHDRVTGGSSLTVDAGTPLGGVLTAQGDALRAKNTIQGSLPLPMYARQVLPQFPSATQARILALEPGFVEGCVMEFTLSDTAQVAGDCVIEAVSQVDPNNVLASRTLTLTASPTVYTLIVHPSDLRMLYKVRVRKVTATANNITVDAASGLHEFGFTEYNAAFDQSNVLTVFNAQHLTFEDFLVEGAGTDAIDVASQYAFDITARRFMSRAANRQGLSCNYAQVVTFEDFKVIGPGRSGIDVEPYDYSWVVEDLTIRNGEIILANNSNWGVSFSNWSSIRNLIVDGLRIEGCLGITGGSLGGSIRNITHKGTSRLGGNASAAYSFSLNGIGMAFSGIRSDDDIIFSNATKIAVDPGRVVTAVTSGGQTAPAAGTIETWVVASTAGFPTTTPFLLEDIDNTHEIMQVTAMTGTSWQVLRGYGGTTPGIHPASFNVYLAWDYQPDYNTVEDITAPSVTQGAYGAHDDYRDLKSNGTKITLGGASQSYVGATVPGNPLQRLIHLDGSGVNPFRLSLPGLVSTEPPYMTGGLWLRQPVTGVAGLTGRNTSGTILAQATHSASGTTTSLDLGTRGATALVWAEAASMGATTTVTVEIQASQDNINWYHVVTLPKITAQGQYEYVKLPRSERYLRAVYTVDGSGAAASASFGIFAEWSLAGNNLRGIGAAVANGTTSVTVVFPTADMPSVNGPIRSLAQVSDPSGTLAAGTYYYRIGARTLHRAPSVWLAEQSVVVDASHNAVTLSPDRWHNYPGRMTEGIAILRGTAPGVYSARFDVLPMTGVSLFPVYHTTNLWTDCGSLVKPASNFTSHPVTYLTDTSADTTLLTAVDQSGYEPDTNYAVQITPSWATTVAVTAKRRNGFDVAFGTAAPAGATFDWFIVR